MKSFSCRSCGNIGIRSILSLGEMPLANRLLTDEQLNQPEPTYPLELVFCPTCTLVQINETLPPEQLFHEYLYFSSFSDTVLQSAEALVARLIRTQRLNAEHFVVEIASNDGYLLQYYQQVGIPLLGIEPAVNIARVAQEGRNIATLNAFFSTQLAQELAAQGKQADVLHANNVLAHVADLNGIVRGIGCLLKADGIAVIEVPYVRNLLEETEFDTIYHEHLCYFSLSALNVLFKRHHLVVQDVECIPMHGGSLRLFVGKSGRPSANVLQMLTEETALGIHKIAFYEQFGARVEMIKRTLRALLYSLKQQGKRIAAYGAAAKGSTLLNYCGIRTDMLDFVVDRSIYKQGRYMPGVHIPIYAPDILIDADVDYVLLLAWNFADEILAQQAAYRSRGGRFIIPIPDIKIIGEL